MLFRVCTTTAPRRRRFGRLYFMVCLARIWPSAIPLQQILPLELLQRLHYFADLLRMVASDHQKSETAAHDRGVKRVCIPNRSTKSAERKREQKKRWFKQGQKWRTGCEGRISVLKRRHGLRRSIYRGDAGMKRWVGLGVIADNLHHLGKVLAERKN